MDKCSIIVGESFMGGEGLRKGVNQKRKLGLGWIFEKVTGVGCEVERSYYCLHCIYSAQNRKMSEAATRRGTRQKKPSRQYWNEEADYSNLLASRNTDQRERVNATQELNQIAKLLCKFMHSANNRYKELIDTLTSEHYVNPQNVPRETENYPTASNRRNDPRSSRQFNYDSRTNRQREAIEPTNGEAKGASKDAKNRNSRVPKPNQQLAASLETDLSYHNALNEHVKNAYPNINALSPDMLRELSIPTEILNKQQAPRLSKVKEQKKQAPMKLGKDENKPFKRQSYHVAIAYHIHLKQVKNTKSVEYVDPTYPARKLREQTQPESKKN